MCYGIAELCLRNFSCKTIKHFVISTQNILKGITLKHFRIYQILGRKMMGQIWIIGGGKFGENATAKLRQKHPEEHLVVVERIFEKCRKFKEMSIDTVCMGRSGFFSVLPHKQHGSRLDCSRCSGTCCLFMGRRTAFARIFHKSPDHTG